MTNELVKKGPIKAKIGSQPVGLAARKKLAEEKAAIARNESGQTVDTTPLFTDPNKMPDRIGIIFDDSGSMAGDTIKDAHKGSEEFLRCSNPKTTAVSVYPMNEKPIKLMSNLPALAVLISNIDAAGGTPALETLESMFDNENLTRCIVFSDGSFGMYGWDKLLLKLKAKEMVVDTVYIGGEHDSYAIENMQKIAKDTGGIFLHFVPGKTSFAKAFKYLSPGLRLRLMDKSFKEKVEKGEV